MSQDENEARLERLLGYRAHDPDNVALAVDCADAALAANRPELAHELLSALAAEGELGEAEANLAGIAAMRAGDQASAQEHFARLLEARPDDTALRFNLAWSLALAGDPKLALDTLDIATIDGLPQAAMLDLQLHHELGEFDEAEARMRAYLERFPGYAPLEAAASVLAMDIDDPELARACATRAGAHPDALATLATLDLGDNKLDRAEQGFVEALRLRQDNPRARIGLGLVKLAEGDSKASLEHLDEGAAAFGDHLGSWIAAGYAHLIAGDRATARERFTTARELDDTFAETHGALAAIDALDGDFEAAKRGMETALRLDRECFSAALAGVLIASAEGDAERAQKILQLALGQPIGTGGQTLAQALAGMSL